MSDKYFQAIHQIIRTGHWITDQVSIELKDFGITEPQYNVLRILRGTKGCPISVQEILEKMIQRSSNVTRIIDKLLSKQYVERKECPENRRKMDISITQKGLNLLTKLDKRLLDFHQTMMGNLEDKELELLQKMIIKLKGNHND